MVNQNKACPFVRQPNVLKRRQLHRGLENLERRETDYQYHVRVGANGRTNRLWLKNKSDESFAAYLVGTNGRDSVDALAEVGVEGTSRHGLETLQLPRSLDAVASATDRKNPSEKNVREANREQKKGKTTGNRERASVDCC